MPTEETTASAGRRGRGWLLVTLGRQRARVIVLGAVGAYFGLLVAVGGHSQWGKLGVGPLRYRFGDLRNLTSAWDCVRMHMAVLPSNPCDPDHRPANYPGILLIPSHLGLGADETNLLGWCVFAVYLIAAVAIIPGRARLGTTVLYGFALCSPAAMLGVERGNVDLVLFALVVPAVLVAQRGEAGRAVSAGLVLFAGILKLFPILAVGFLARQGSRRALVRVGAVLVAFAAYAFAIHNQLRQINAALPRQDKYSYGLRRVSEWLSAGLEGHGAKSASLPSWDILLAIAIGVGSLFVVRRLRAKGGVLRAGASERDLDLFWAGSCVYVGSYLLTRNFDYRLVFLLLTVPQLARWASAGSKLAYLTIVALLGTTWLDAGPFEWSHLRSLLDGWSSWTATGPQAQTLPLSAISQFVLCTTLVAWLLATAPRVQPVRLRRAAAAA
jgi:hypothetical protein